MSKQYATAKPFFEKIGKVAENLSASMEDADRIRSYELYEDFYYNVPDSFKILIRGEDNEPVYIPSAKKIVEAMNRFLCKNFAFFVPPSGDPSLAEAEGELLLRIGNLFKREKFQAKFASQKRNGLIRGDAMWYVVADPTKKQFARLSLYELDPGNVFYIIDPNDKERILGLHIVETISDPREKDDKTKMITRRRTYLKAGVRYDSSTSQYTQDPTDVEGIWTEVTHWAIGKWDDRNMKNEDMEQIKIAMDVPMFQLPPQITSLPVYHWKNSRRTGTHYGDSEVSGIETLIDAINQGISDTNLTMILQGLGLYVTDSKPPVDASGKTTNWNLGPAGVVETAQGSTFQRVSGVGSVSPYLDFLTELKNSAQEANGIPDIAAGKVDVSVAESGISLQLQLAPIIASSQEKELEILGTMDHLLYDLKNQWFPAYEEIEFSEEIDIVSKTDDPLPVNREARVQEVMLLFTSNLITIAAAQAELAKLGYSFAAGDEKQVLRDAAALAQAQQGDMENRFGDKTTLPNRDLSEGAGELPADALGGDSFGGGSDDPSGQMM